MSSREIHILQMKADGYDYRAIASELNTSEAYIKNIGRKILTELGADNMTQAVAMAIRRKLIA